MPSWDAHGCVVFILQDTKVNCFFNATLKAQFRAVIRGIMLGENEKNLCENVPVWDPPG